MDRLSMQNMPRHITIVGWLHIALNLTSIGFAIFASVYFDATFLPVAIVIFSVPGLIAGVALIKLRPWARMLVIVMSILNLLTFPHGTAIGIYSMIILFDQEVISLLVSDANRSLSK